MRQLFLVSVVALATNRSAFDGYLVEHVIEGEQLGRYWFPKVVPPFQWLVARGAIDVGGVLSAPSARSAPSVSKPLGPRTISTRSDRLRYRHLERAPLDGHELPRLTIGSIHYLDTYGPTDKVRVFRGRTANIEVSGKLLDLATGVEVKSSSGGSSGMVAVISKRTGGDNTSIQVDVTVPTAEPLGTYQVLIHYAIEVNGPDRFLVQVFDRGTVTSLRIVEPPNLAGGYLTGQPYTLVVGGDHLENAALLTAKVSSGMTASAIGTGSSTEKRFSIQFRQAGSIVFAPDDFFDQNLPTAPPASCPVQCYGGATSLPTKAFLAPTVTAISNRTPPNGSTVTLSGSGLSAVGAAVPFIVGRARYGTSGQTIITPTTVSGNDVSFVANANVRQDSLAFEFRNGSASLFRLPLAPIAVQGANPEVVDFTADSLSVPGTSIKRKVILAKTHTLRGHFLVANPLLSFALTAPVTTTTTGLPTGTLSPSLPASPPSQPSLRFVTSLDLTTARYDQTARVGSVFGLDVVTFDMPNLPDTISADFKITTPAGSTTIPSLFHAPPPSIAFIRRKLSTGSSVVVSDAKLIKGATYEIGGRALILVSNGQVMQAGTVRLNGAVIPHAIPLAAPGSALVITIPATATSGALTVETIAGTSPALNFTVSDAAAPVALAGFQLSPANVVGGQPLTATVAVNAAVPAGTTIGNLFFSQASQVPSALTLPVTRPINANPVVFNIPTRVTRVPMSSTITVTTSEPPSAPANTATATVTIVPPSPTAITFNNASVIGGTPVTATIQMNGSATLGDSIVIALTNSDPTTATVPASVALNGSSATVQIPTLVVPTVRTLTISATSGGQTRSATLTVNPPTIATVIPASASAVGPGTVAVAVALTASLPSPQTATIACSGQGLTCPASITLSGTGGSFDVTLADVPNTRTGTITVTFNSISRSGTLDIQPLALQTMTASPGSVAAGSSTSITLQLNHLGATTLQLTSSDSTVINLPPTSIAFNGTQLTRLITIQTRAPQTQPKTVTITATGTHSSTFGPTPITKSVTVTVTP